MSRRDFGAWGLELSDDDFACALAAAGVLLAATGPWWLDRDVATLEEYLDGALQGGDVPVPWAYALPFRSFSQVQLVGPAARFASAWRKAVGGRPRGPRLVIELHRPLHAWFGFPEVPPYPWLIEQLSRPAIGASSVYLRQDAPEAEISWAWPLRIGLLGDPTSDGLRQEIAVNRWHPALTEIVTVPAPGVECDVLLLPFDLRNALLAVMEAPAPLRADCVVVLGGPARSDANIESRMLSLRAEARTAGVLVGDVAADDRARWLNVLMNELAHGTPLDVALTLACRATSVRAPLFVGSRRLVETAHVTTGALALSRALERFAPGQAISLDVLPPRVRDRLRVDPFAAAASVDHLRQRFAEIVDALELEHEGDDATTIAALAQASKLAPELASRPSRHLQAQAFVIGSEDEAKQVTGGLRVGAAHRIDIRIGAAAETWAVLADAFPDEELPRQGSVHKLTVVLTEPRLAPDPQVATILLPHEGNSEVASFYLLAREGVDRMDARITILHENRVLQTARLRAAISREPDGVPERDRLTLEPETVVSTDLADLGGRRTFDVALLLNHTGNDPQATAIAGEYASLIALRNVEGFVSKIADQLSKVAWNEDDYASFDSEATRKLFFFLATQGSLLFKEILDGASESLKPRLREARTVQIVAAKRGDVLPFELAYTFAAPKKTAQICKHGIDALAGGLDRCPGGCENGNADVICPLGFWGLSRVIERQSDGLLPLGGTGADFGIRLTPGTRRRLEILKSAVFAASSRVDKEVAGSSEVVRKALVETTREHTKTAQSWDAWVEDVKTSPSLLALLVHAERDKDADVQAIEIGEEDMLLVSQVSDAHVRVDPAVRPVVLLVGCRTSLSEVEFQQFPVQFQRSGAALVLGTVATVLGRRAGPVAARLIRTIAELTAKGDVPFGEALLATKRKLVSEGELMAMCLCAHGDADWILGAPQKENP